jgi:hypothetical protein
LKTLSSQILILKNSEIDADIKTCEILQLLRFTGIRKKVHVRKIQEIFEVSLHLLLTANVIGLFLACMIIFVSFFQRFSLKFSVSIFEDILVVV